MSQDTQFTAKGPTDIGFETSGDITNFHFGGQLVGTKAGVQGVCTNPGSVGQATPAGVQGCGAGPGVAGVYGIALPGENGLINPGPGVWGQGGGGNPLIPPPPGSVNGDGVGVYGVAGSAEGGVFSSESGAQLRLVPSSVPMDEDNPLMQTGQVGDLYLYTEATEVGTTGTYHFNTILWLCVSPAWQHEGDPAVWAQVQLGDTIGG
jgi:hypothetical protein